MNTKQIAADFLSSRSKGDIDKLNINLAEFLDELRLAESTSLSFSDSSNQRASNKALVSLAVATWKKFNPDLRAYYG